MAGLVCAHQHPEDQTEAGKVRKRLGSDQLLDLISFRGRKSHEEGSLIVMEHLEIPAPFFGARAQLGQAVPCG